MSKSSKRPKVDGVRLPTPEAIDHSRRKHQPQPEQRIQPSVRDIQEEAYRQYIERQPPGERTEGGVTIISIGGDDEED